VTLSAWIKPDLNAGGWQRIIMHGGPNSETFALYINSDSRTIVFITNGTTNAWFESDSTNTLWDGKWHHIVAVYNGGEKVIYIDNVAVSTVTASGKMDIGFGFDLLIGAGRDESDLTTFYNGKIDEVRIYNYAISNDEVAELYHSVNRELNKISIVEDVTICEGEEYMGWTQSGQYERVLQRIPEFTSGADSIVLTNLFVNPDYHFFEEINIPDGGTYKGWTESGTYELNLVSSQGCDSTVIINLTVGQLTNQLRERDKGWNLFSSFLIPDDLSMESVTEVLRNEG